ncbi:unnamed protein product [Adineta ricciae]|uniref:HAT C-terminal dimerisation domain-containing protein n=1 Tax=Adineta ricciae TaxID=249248 RepID=A0A814YYA6_ADIRI|nr:unnamed protein product [Adineta ricciae]
MIDTVLLELNDRFSVNNIAILIGISVLCADDDNFLQIDRLKPFALHMKTDFCSLSNEIEANFYYHLLPLQRAFPVIMSLIIAAMNIPVSSTTCERTFSKMKLIKTTARNTMSDNRVSDLCVLAEERDFVIGFKKLMDDFADFHKNSEILLN